MSPVTMFGAKGDSNSRYEKLFDVIEANIIRLPWSGCWIWTAGLFENGYAQLRIGTKKVRVHRMVLEHTLNRPLASDVLACHTCDIKCCVNPAHIFADTFAGNAWDREAKGRGRWGFRRNWK